MKFGITLGRLRPEWFLDASLAAERLGFESVWIPEHLVLTAHLTGSPYPGTDHPPIPPSTPVFDAFVYLAFLAGRTRRLRLGTHVFNIGLRHPFTTARAVQTLDVVSGGRVELGVGASWLESEWVATQLDFQSRGRRVDEAISVVKRLWCEPMVSHRGEFFTFEDVVFEPKPAQRPGPPLLVGGESRAALRRAARLGDGWIGMWHDLPSAAPQIARLGEMLAAEGRDPATFQIVVSADVASRQQVLRWEDLGVTRLIVAPWTRSRESVAGLERFAERMGLEA